MACRLYKLTLLATLVFLLCSCASQQIRVKSSVMDYLYPNKSSKRISPDIPTLSLPVKLGVAFVPGQTYGKPSGYNAWTKMNSKISITEANKTKLLETIADKFIAYNFISNIQIIPTDYLTIGGGFSNLDQISNIYDIDIIALVSYDQIQFTDENALSLSYWTIVGAYLIPAEKNDTTTLLDTAVFDISSRKMLFRAPGTSTIKSSATLININKKLREDSIKGFELAAIDMVANLDDELNKFKERVKNEPEKIKIIKHKNYVSGAGSFDFIILILVITLCALRIKQSISPAT